ncbi:MAG: hypothetical protein ABI718_01475 [Acidobacteriota bacterium]
MRAGSAPMVALGRAPRAVLILGALAGAFVALLLGPSLRPLFHAPQGGVGALTVASYPKSFDYLLITLIAVGSGGGAALAGVLFGRRNAEPGGGGDARFAVAARRRSAIAVAALFVLTFAVYFAVHHHPYYELDFFHDGEHLSPAFELLHGGRPYRDVFFLHGFAVDGGLDALLIGSPPDPMRVRRAMALLDAAAVALLVLVASECLSTWGGLMASVVLSLCAIGAGQVDVFPYFRLAPILLSLWGLLRYFRTRRIVPLFVAALSATLGILWSLEVGLYATGAMVMTLLVDRVLFRSRALSLRQYTVMTSVAVAVPLAVLLVTGADIPQFLRDSFLIIPESIDAVWSLPAPAAPDISSLISPAALWSWLDSESARYFLPPVIYGFLVVLGLRDFQRGREWSARRSIALGIFAFFLLRTAVGRAGWSHNRFAAPLLGIALAATVLEPMWMRFAAAPRKHWMWLAGIVLVIAPIGVILEVPKNFAGARKFISQRQERGAPPAGSALYPLRTGGTLVTYPENAADLSALDDFVRREAPPGKSIFVFSGEKALYYLLSRHSATRVQDIPMLSAPRLERQALKQLRRNPPALVIVHGMEGLDSFDGVSNRVRVPRIADWIDHEYPRRVHVGRFLVALPR